MKEFYQIMFVVLFALNGCNQMPHEVLNKQLTTLRYYREEMEGGVKHRTSFYYKPYEYLYNGKPFSGKVKDCDDKGVLKSEGFMKNGFPDGLWIYYNRNGTLKSKGRYVNGIADSAWFRYYTDGSLKLMERISLRGDTLHSDTIDAWFYNGQKYIDTRGDTIRRYYPEGRLLSKAILDSQKLREVYSRDGTVILRTDIYSKENFYVDGKLRSRTYYLSTKEGRERFLTEAHKWTKEEKTAIESADSVLFDYSTYWDPVIKIYVKD